MSNDPLPQSQPQLAECSAILREELKSWEKSFAAINGRKAGRDDIKSDRSIASKYKEYRKLRDRLSNKHDPPPESGPPIETGPSTTSRKRNGPPQHVHTPRRLPPSTPSRGIHPADLDPYDSPLSVRKLLFANEPRTSIGPTPQRNGKVLGLFDLLEEDKVDSPSRMRRGALLDGSSNVLVTPRKGGAGAEGRSGWKSGGSTPAARTPVSSSKRRLYEAFTTPLKRQKLGAVDGGSSVSDAQFATPSFLRRDNQGAGLFSTTGDDGEPTPASPVIRMPAKPPVRGLSSMLAQLRQMEDKALDDEMDILREIEMGNTRQPAKPSSGVTPIALPQGNQTKPSGELPTNTSATEATGGGGVEGDEKPVLGRNGKPLKVWKKRGQKRTTRRVILRPVRMKPRSNPEPATVDDGDASGDELQATVTGDASTSRTNGKGFIDDDDDDEPPEVDDNHVPAPTTDNGDSRKNDASRKHHDTRGNRSTTNHNNPQEGGGAKEGPAKRAVKKVNSQAHANFRRLKLRNKNSKGKGRGMSFKRRR
ncbi:MAG: DNA replication regulator sld2 [Trichoglossum hirsutum]|nr:MAG: DNA replication regulator sld2 [Trichoglossum hirsutum]